MTQRTHDTDELVRVMMDLAAEQEPPIDANLIQAIIEAESMYFESRALARRRVEDVIESHLRHQ